MEENERKRKSSLAELFSALQKARIATSFFGFGAIGGITAAVLVFVFVFVFMNVVSTGISGQSEVSPTTVGTNPVPKTNIKFYCQYDPRWTDAQCRIANFGCDPTSLAIILGSFGDTSYTPTDVATRNGRMGCSGATSKNETIDALRWVRSLGYKVAGLGDDEDASGYLVRDDGEFNFLRAKKFLDAGYLIHAGAVVTFKSGGIKRGGHSFVISDVNPQAREITAYDPTYCSSDQDLGIRTILPDDVGGDGTNDTWFWAFPVKKEGVVR